LLGRHGWDWTSRRRGVPTHRRIPPYVGMTSALAMHLEIVVRTVREQLRAAGPKSVSPATNCSGVALVVWWRWIVIWRAPWLDISWLFPAFSARPTRRPIGSPWSPGKTRGRRQPMWDTCCRLRLATLGAIGTDRSRAATQTRRFVRRPRLSSFTSDLRRCVGRGERARRARPLPSSPRRPLSQPELREPFPAPTKRLRNLLDQGTIAAKARAELDCSPAQ
jgi:hypothetical protein